MKKKKIESQIKKAINNSVPDNFEQILSKCKRKGEIVMEIKEQTKQQSKRNYIPRISYAIALIIITFIGIYLGYNENYKVKTKIELDVNPSIELKANNKDKIIEVQAKNEEGQKVLENMQLEKTNVETALNAIIGSMLTKGYINELSNSVLLSIENKNPEKSEELRVRLATQINNILEEDKISGSVLSQNISSLDQKAKELVKKHNISEGKATLIVEILENNPLLTEKDLKGLSINELNIISEKEENELKTIERKGTASTKSYIGKEKAKQIALTHANVTKPQKIEIEFDADNGIIVYEIEFETNKYEYEYEIDATTGKIVKDEKEIKEKIQANKKNQKTENQSYIGKEKAKQIAITHANVTNPQKIEIDLDEENKTMVYEIEFETNKYEYEYEIDATTGKIIRHDKEKK